METQKQTAQIAVIENSKLAEIVQKSGVELTKAEGHVSAFHPALKELAELSRPLAGLNQEDPAHAKIARENRLKLVKVRSGAESIKDDRKKLLLSESNLIQSAFNLVKDACLLTESEYEEIEKAEERREKARRDVLKAERIAMLAPFQTDTEYLPLDVMEEDKFQAFFLKEKEAFEAVQAARVKAEKDRIESERIAEAARLAEIEAEKVRQAERELENARLKKEAEIREAQVAKERIENEKILAAERAEAAKMAAAKQAEIDKANEEAAKVRAELKKKQLAEENERLAKIAEQEQKEAAAKALLLAPDKEKVKVFFAQFTALSFPELESAPGKKMAIRVTEALQIVKKVIIEDSKTLL
jgi:hypothetical protein